MMNKGGVKMSDNNTVESVREVLNKLESEQREIERQRLLSRAIDFAPGIYKLSENLPTPHRSGKHLSQTYQLVLYTLAENAEYTFNIPADEFTRIVKERANNETTTNK